MFGVSNMGSEEYLRDFRPWHEEQRGRTDWCLKTELVRYCRSDVEVLG